MFFLYVLRSDTFDRFYVGMSEDVEKRLISHNKGKTRSTKGYRPWKLFFKEGFESRAEARQREKFFKTGKGRELIRSKWQAGR